MVWPRSGAAQGHAAPSLALCSIDPRLIQDPTASPWLRHYGVALTLVPLYAPRATTVTPVRLHYDGVTSQWSRARPCCSVTDLIATVPQPATVDPVAGDTRPGIIVEVSTSKGATADPEDTDTSAFVSRPSPA